MKPITKIALISSALYFLPSSVITTPIILYAVYKTYNEDLKLYKIKENLELIKKCI